MSIGNVKVLGLEPMSRAVFVCIKMNVPVIIWGESGWAKSALLRKVSKAIGHEFRDIRAGQHDPTEFAVPCPMKDEDSGAYHIQYATANYLPFESHVKESNVLLALEEIDRGTMAMQNALLSILMEREFAQQAIGPNVKIVATGNGAADPGGTLRLNEAAERRMVHLFLDHKSKQTRDSLINYGGSAGWHPTTLESIKALWPDLCEEQKPYRFYEYGSRCGRTIEYADKILRAYDSGNVGVDMEDIIEPLVCGAVGVDFGTLLWNDWITRNKYDLEAILRDPENAEIPKKPDEVIAIRDLLSDTIGQKRGLTRIRSCDAAIRWASRLPAEQAIGVIESLADVAPDVRTAAPSYKKFMEENEVSR